MEIPAIVLKKEIEHKEKIMPFIGVYDAFSATIAANYSPNLFLSGFSMAASYYGLPDIGYITWSDLVNFAWRIRMILPSHRLLVDIDDGFMDTESACHVTQQLDTMGVAMIMLEDQERPRRCGHFDNKIVMPLDGYLEKLDRVLKTRKNMLVLARTDSSGEEIYRRVEAMSKTDADVLLVDGVHDLKTLRTIRKITKKPLLFNHIAGGKSPKVSLSELEEIGVHLSLYSTPSLFAAHRAINESLSHIFENDGLLPDEGIGALQCSDLLQKNMNRLAKEQKGSK